CATLSTYSYSGTYYLIDWYFDIW
nr:immunoglobulin heavy chain junction region [Macaca mulatta]